jgi:hypothetical protein
MTDAPPPAAPPRNNSLRVLIDNPWAVLILLFAVTGFLGIPVLWMSRGFTTTMKVVLSIVVTIYTLALIGCTVAILWWAWSKALSGT